MQVGTEQTEAAPVAFSISKEEAADEDAATDSASVGHTGDSALRSQPVQAGEGAVVPDTEAVPEAQLEAGTEQPAHAAAEAEGLESAAENSAASGIGVGMETILEPHSGAHPGAGHTWTTSLPSHPRS